jgi:regulator of RNase E activity RraA
MNAEAIPIPSTASTAATPSTAAISDALDALGLPGSLHGIGPLCLGQRIAGPVYTVRYEPIGDEGGTVGDFLDEVEGGRVIVIDNSGRTDCTVWGGIMTQVAKQRAVAGTIINGVCRDVRTSLEVDYPIWSAGRFMRTGKDRVRLAAVQAEIVIDGVRIRPDDWLVADEDGAVVIPIERRDEVIAAAERIEAVELAIVGAVQAGATLSSARAQHGYHSLQTRSHA